MALDLAGISNLEFYSPHYLEAVLESDLKAVFNKWKQAKDEKGAKQPHERLSSLANPYFQAIGKAEGERDPVRRWEIAREFHVSLLEALGYPYQPETALLDDNSVCPLVLALERDGNPFLWVIDAPFVEEEDDDPLGATPYPEQLPKDNLDDPLPKNKNKDYATWREILDNQVFHGDKAPRWVLFLAGSEVLLIERNKWPQGRYLRFELTQIFSRRQTATLKAVAGLLHKDSLAPDAGICLHDTLDENSHKHAYAVSTDLKYGVRRAVELLGNEAVWYRREVQRQAVFDEDAFPPEELTSECLTFLYRMLFLFYIEARGGDLGIVPMNAEVYRDGYSLETLRDLEVVPLTTEKARNGYYIHDSLRTLFHIINEGYPNNQFSAGELDLEDSYHDSMRIDAMNSPLFDDRSSEDLRSVRFRNIVLQEVLQLLSLSAEKKRRSRGRISYAQLGINQLGAVYEGLLSYTGFFATKTSTKSPPRRTARQLSGKARQPNAKHSRPTSSPRAASATTRNARSSKIENDTEGRPQERHLHLPPRRPQPREVGQLLHAGSPDPVPRQVRPQGAALGGGRRRREAQPQEDRRRDPRPHHLRARHGLERLPHRGRGPAGRRLPRGPAGRSESERGRDHPARGLPAREAPGEGPPRHQQLLRRGPEPHRRRARQGLPLARHPPRGRQVPLVRPAPRHRQQPGGRPPRGLQDGRRHPQGHEGRPQLARPRARARPAPPFTEEGEDAPPPDEVDWANWTAPPRPKGTIYHFLLPAEGMAAFDKDKVIKQLAPESVKRIKEWRKEFCKPFNKKDAERLEQISDAVDRLFAQVVRERVLATQETSDRIPVWGERPERPAGRSPRARSGGGGGVARGRKLRVSAAQARDGCLVCAVVLADRGGGAAAGSGDLVGADGADSEGACITPGSLGTTEPFRCSGTCFPDGASRKAGHLAQCPAAAGR